MNTTHILPAVDLIDGRCVRLREGRYDRLTQYAADPVDQIKLYVDHGMRRVHVVDLDGARLSAPANLAVLEKMAAVSGAEIEWGGGLKTPQAVADSLNAGASYVIIGSAAVRNPELMDALLAAPGPEQVVLGADADSEGHVAVTGWTEKTSLTLNDIIDRFIPSGLSQVITTDISRDGMLQGPAFELYKRLMADYPSVIFTASGGISGISDVEKLAEMGVPRVIVGKAIYENRVTLAQLQSINAC